LLLLALVLTGCAHPTAEEPAAVNVPQYLTRVNFYSNDGSLRDQFRIEYDPTGMPVMISSGIMQDQRVDNPLGGAPVLPEGVQLDQADSTYQSILLAPCDEGTALLVSGTAQQPLWGMVLYGSDYAERKGYLTKVTANDGSYIALFYSPLGTAADNSSDLDNTSFPVTEDSEYNGYDAVLTALGTAIVASERGEPATLNSLLFSPLYDSEPDKNNIGYAFVDLDGNGTQELILGGREQFSRPTIYNLYAIYNGRIVNVLSGSDAVQHTLSTGNEILMDTKNEAGQTVFAVFSYYNSSIRLKEAVIQDGGDRFHSTESISDAATFESVSRNEATAIQEQYIMAEIEFTPISDYIASTGLNANP
jgi:hypothetical protein